MEEPRVLAGDENYLALVKPFGMPSQPDLSGDRSLLDWAVELLGHPVHLLHRLDRPTGGVVIFAKSSRAAASLSLQFQERTVKKSYLTVVEGEILEESFELEHHLGKLPGKNFVRAYDKPVRGSKPARLRGVVRQRCEEAALLEIELLTGRRHQIRAQLQRLKLSILGDHKYGKSKQTVDFPGIALWSYSLAFIDSKGHEVKLIAPPPSGEPWIRFDGLRN